MFAAVVVTLAVAAPVPKAADAWVGKTVFPRTRTVRMTQMNDDGSESPVAPAYMSYRAVRDEGDRVQVINNGRRAWFRKADAVRAEDAVAHFDALLLAQPGDTTWLNYRASAFRELGRYDESVKVYDDLIRTAPTTSAWFNNRSLAKIGQKKYDDAVADLSKALELNPDSAVSWRNRGWAQIIRKKYAEAVPDLTRAIELGPQSGLSFATAHAFRSQAYAHLGKFELAAADAAEAIQQEPLGGAGLNAKAFLLATAADAKYRDAKGAIAAAELACDVTAWRTGGYVETLAAAHAEAGDFATAVRWQEEAMKDKKYANASRADSAERLALYRAKKPVRVGGEKR